MQIVIISCSLIGERLIDALRCFGIKSQYCDNLTDAAELIDVYGIDLAFVDIGFAADGVSAVKALRMTHKTLPIVVFGADMAREQALSCFSAGADDILRWPGDTEIIAARFRAIVRRCRGADAAALQIGPLRFDMIRRSLEVNDMPVILTNKEYGVLEYMVTHKGMVLTKDAMINQLYGSNDAPDGRIIDVFVCKLRKKLADYGVFELIETVRGLGYVLNERTCRFIQQTSGTSNTTREIARVA